MFLLPTFIQYHTGVLPNATRQEKKFMRVIKEVNCLFVDENNCVYRKSKIISKENNTKIKPARPNK